MTLHRSENPQYILLLHKTFQQNSQNVDTSRDPGTRLGAHVQLVPEPLQCCKIRPPLEIPVTVCSRALGSVRLCQLHRLFEKKDCVVEKIRMFSLAKEMVLRKAPAMPSTTRRPTGRRPTRSCGEVRQCACEK